MRFVIFPVHLSKVLRLPRKIDARSYEVLHLSRKIILANLHIWYSKMQPLSGNQRPDRLTSLMNMSFVLRLPRKMHLCSSSSNVPCLPSFFGNIWKCYKTLTFCSLLKRCTIPCACHAKRILNLQKWSEPLVLLTFWLRHVLRATTPCTFSTSQLAKVVRQWCVLCMLTSKCASRHNGVTFFILFRHLNFQKWSEADVFCTFWLRNVLRATMACNFSSLIWPAGSAPAALASLLFDPLEPQIIGKTQSFATFLPFRASASSFFWLFLFSDLLSSNLSLLSSSALLCFSSVHTVGSLTSKLPSATDYYWLLLLLTATDYYLLLQYLLLLTTTYQ